MATNYNNKQSNKQGRTHYDWHQLGYSVLKNGKKVFYSVSDYKDGFSQKEDSFTGKDNKEHKYTQYTKQFLISLSIPGEGEDGKKFKKVQARSVYEELLPRVREALEKFSEKVNDKHFSANALVSKDGNYITVYFNYKDFSKDKKNKGKVGTIYWDFIKSGEVKEILGIEPPDFSKSKDKTDDNSLGIEGIEF